MHRTTLLLLTTPIVSAMAVALAAAQPYPPKPYATVAIALPAAAADESFTKFRRALAAVAKRRIYSELEALVRTYDFFWGRDFGNGFEPRKPAVDNLAAAIQLERHDGLGWRLLASFAAESSIEPLASRPGVFCAPARPSYDGVAFAKLLHATYTGSTDWAFPRADKIPVRGAPEPRSAAIGTLGMHFIQFLGYAGIDNEPSPGHVQWARIITPDAKVGFVAPGSLMSLAAEQLCYIKDLVGWRITGYIAAGH
jgi:hypothetical protein